MSGRADIAQCRMATLPIAERFNVKENVGASQRTGFVDTVFQFSKNGTLVNADDADRSK